MRTSKTVLVVMCSVALIGLSGCDLIVGFVKANRAAVKWEGPVKEITFAKLDKDGAVFDIELHSRIDAPVDKVWAAMKQPERLADNSEQYKLSRLLKEEGNTKQIEIHMLALDNMQILILEMSYDDAAKKMTMKTIASSMVDMEGSYQLTPSPDGTKTLYVHKATQTDKIQIPISTDVQRSAIKETFVNQINAIKTQLGSS